MAKKFYAVRRGRKVGIFLDWATCLQQVDSFADARYKGFFSRAEAEAWLAGEDVPRHKTSTQTFVQESTTPDKNLVHVYTDGSCLHNPGGSGGWAYCILADGAIKKASGGDPETTNNRMELTAAIKALCAIPEGTSLLLSTDSQYLKNGITKWLAGWKRRHWRRATGEPVLNRDLWEQLDALLTKRKVHFQWVKGHAGNHYNEICDTLAREAAIQAKK